MASQKLLGATIDLPNRRLIVIKNTFLGKREAFRIDFADLSKMTLAAVPFSLWDGIGIIAETADGRSCFVEETQNPFLAFADLFRFSEIFGPDWYMRTSEGERFEWTPQVGKVADDR